MTATRRTRLSVAECRRLLERQAPLSDSQVESIRDQLYEIAERVATQYAKRQCPGGGEDQHTHQLEQFLNQVPIDGRCAIAERAAILEFEAGMTRDQAERSAVADWLDRER